MQTNSPQDTTVETKQTLGNLIQKNRKSSGKTLEDISKSTGISISSLQALEDGDRKALPADVFVRGFIRMYSSEIGLDSQVALNMFEQEWGGERSHIIDERHPLQPEAYAKSSIIMRRWPAFATITICCIIIYFSAKFFFPALFVVPTKQIGEILSNKLPEIEIINKTANHANPLSSSEEPNTTEQNSIPEAENLAPKVASTLNETKETDLEIQEPVINSQNQIGEQPGTLPSTGDFLSDGPRQNAEVSNLNALQEVDHYTLHIQFTERTWIKISLDGQDPQEEIFKRGSEQTWDADKSIDLYLGNAGGVRVSLNGEPISLKQESGQTVRLQFP